MNTKAWYLSKGVWTGIVTAVLGLYLTLAPNLGWPAIPEMVFVVLGSLGIYTRASANSTITK